MAEMLLGGVKLFCTEEKAELGGKNIKLAHMERRLLLFFLERPNETLSRETLLQAVWGYVPGSITRTVDSHVKKLRRHLGSYRDCIVTVRGVGYRLEPARENSLSSRGAERYKKSGLKAETKPGV